MLAWLFAALFFLGFAGLVVAFSLIGPRASSPHFGFYHAASPTRKLVGEIVLVCSVVTFLVCLVILFLDFSRPP